MREIKFRAWDKKDEKMIPDYMELIDNGYHYWGLDFTDGREVEVMQYTGLKDKNGQEIYEGDIVRWEGFYPDGEVVYKDAGFYITPNKSLSETYSKEYEVVGNIFENPELLK